MVPAVGWSYTNAFTLTFEQASDADHFSDTANSASVIAAGENAAIDNPPYSVKPEVATGYNGTKWLRTGNSDTTMYGVATFAYDGFAGGGGTVQDFEATVDVFINPQFSDPNNSANPLRHQVGLMGRWTSGNNAFMVFYSRGTPNYADGFGWRYGGSTATWGEFTTATLSSPRWVRLKTHMQDNIAQMSVDQDLDGTYDYISPEITVAVNPGQLALQSVINDPNNGSKQLPDRFAYWDNLHYVPLASVSEWSLY